MIIRYFILTLHSHTQTLVRGRTLNRHSVFVATVYYALRHTIGNLATVTGYISYTEHFVLSLFC